MVCISSSFVAVFSVFLVLGVASAAQLSPNYYDSSCPNALSTIKSAVEDLLFKEPQTGADFLRLHFHDCFVNGCDASVLLDDTSTFTGEKTARSNNNSLGGFDEIDIIKSKVDSICPGVVSCADIVAVAARDSVVALGGLPWTVQLGRRDSTTASFSTANTDLPSPASNLSDLIFSFSNKGFTMEEMVALSGAHTIGQARCAKFRARIYWEENIDTHFASSLRRRCPVTGRDDNMSPLDYISERTFDNAYYEDLLSFKGLLHSDQQLYNGGSADFQVINYATNSSAFLSDFANAMLKMGNLGPLTGTDGEIRNNCRKTNN